MKTSGIIKGLTAVAVVGTAAYLYSTSSPRTKRRIKRTAGRALHSAGEIMSGFSGIM